MDDQFFEKIGASITAALLIVWGALKALAKWLKPKPSSDLRELGELVDQLREISQREREHNVGDTVSQLMVASSAQGQQINGLQVEVAGLSATVEGIDDRVQLLENERR